MQPQVGLRGARQAGGGTIDDRRCDEGESRRSGQIFDLTGGMKIIRDQTNGIFTEITRE